MSSHDRLTSTFDYDPDSRCQSTLLERLTSILEAARQESGLCPQNEDEIKWNAGLEINSVFLESKEGAIESLRTMTCRRGSFGAVNLGRYTARESGMASPNSTAQSPGVKQPLEIDGHATVQAYPDDRRG